MNRKVWTRNYNPYNSASFFGHFHVLLFFAESFLRKPSFLNINIQNNTSLCEYHSRALSRENGIIKRIRVNLSQTFLGCDTVPLESMYRLFKNSFLVKEFSTSGNLFSTIGFNRSKETSQVCFPKTPKMIGNTLNDDM